MQARAVSALVLLLAVGCERKPQKPPPPASSTPATSGSAATSASPPTASARSVERDELIDAGSATDAGANAAIELFDIGPAGPATATSRGVVLLTRDDQLSVTALPSTVKGAPAPVSLDAGQFAAFARGPAVLGEHAFWISKGRLVRAKLSGGRVDVLSEDARDGTRVSAASFGGKAVVAYITRPASADGDAAARLWVDGGDPLRLSPEGAAASSVTLAETSRGVMAFTLEGRTAMTPVHARLLLEKGGKTALDEDVVVWVGGSAQTSTEIVAAESAAGEVWGFVAIERDVSRFGLAALAVGERPKMGVPITWRIYPNGLDPAPISVVRACGDSWLAYVSPSEAKPGAPQELHLSSLALDGLGPSRVLARAKAFANTSLAATPEGIVAAYTADHRTWAARVRCAAKK
ncbi:MAG: hypothetical protein IPI67_28725 [Myxococcales bacterium]|nr:hypothetical protein [Myxococcales bacterium]